MPATTQAGAECPAEGWSTCRAPPQPRPLNRVPSVQVRTAGRLTCARHRPGRAMSAEWPANLPTGPRHHPCHSAECRECKSGWLDHPPCPATDNAGRQSAERASPARWTIHRALPPPMPLDRVPSVQVRPAGRPACAHHHPGRAPSAKRPSSRPAWPCHCTGRPKDCRACKPSRPDDPPVPATAQAEIGRAHV